MNTNSLASLSLPLILGIGVLIVVQLTLDVLALLDLYKRDKSRVQFENKWIWVAVIVLVNTIGAVIYLVAGRKPAAAAESPTKSNGDAATNVVNVLYGAPKDPEKQ